MTETITDTAALPLLGADWSDPIEDGIRGRVRGWRCLECGGNCGSAISSMFRLPRHAARSMG